MANHQFHNSLISLYVHAHMKNIKTLLTVSALLFSIIFVSAQTSIWCGSTKKLEAQIKNDPQARAQFEAYMYGLQQQDNSSSGSRSSNTIWIPVVFHIVHNGDAIGTGENITDAQAASQLDAMNTQYNALDPNLVNLPSAFVSLVGTANVKFCLAKFDESGNPTTGIIRHQLTNVTWDSETDIDNTLKPATIWDHTKYLNIWSVRMGGQLSADGVLAYAILPYSMTADNDGIVARYNTIGTTGSLLSGYNKGKTVTHEAGHWLGLLHTWGLNANCGDYGDFIDDTPDQADLNAVCPSFPHQSCNTLYGDMFMNYMDYPPDACSNMFSVDQVGRMRSILDGSRASIKTASTQCFYSLDASLLKLILPADTICSLSFNPLVTIKNEGATTIVSGKFYVQLDGGGAQIINWNGNLEPQSQIQVTLPLQTVVSGTHAFDITFGDINGTAGDNFMSNNTLSTVVFYAYDGGVGETLPYSEGFETLFPAGNWAVSNPNHDITWVQNSNSGGYAATATSASINNFGYSSLPNFLKKDALITGAFDFTNVPQPELKFDLAYCQFSNTRTDSLNVYYSLDCGSNWIKVWGQRGNQLATSPDQTTAFVPDATQWKTVSIPMLFVSGQSKVSFKFENVSNWGNVMYLDNINLQNNPALAVREINKADVKIYPNPTSGLVAVRLPSTHSFRTMQVFNSIGELMYETVLTDNAVIFSVQHYSCGLYFIHLKGETVSQIEKLMKQ